MIEDSAELGNYLLLSFKTRSEQDYIAFLWDAFESNTPTASTSSPFLLTTCSP
jgi:hypothetical protein